MILRIKTNIYDLPCIPIPIVIPISIRWDREHAPAFRQKPCLYFSHTCAVSITVYTRKASSVVTSCEQSVPSEFCSTNFSTLWNLIKEKLTKRRVSGKQHESDREGEKGGLGLNSLDLNWNWHVSNSCDTLWLWKKMLKMNWVTLAFTHIKVIVGSNIFDLFKCFKKKNLFRAKNGTQHFEFGLAW